MNSNHDRNDYLGATDVAAVLGLSPYRAPIQVWNEKRGSGPPQPQSLRMRLGQLLESAVADAYTETTGRKLRRVGFIAHPVYPFLGGHPDRLVIGERGVVEVKTSASTRGYDVGEVPPHVQVQAVWYCGLTNRDWCDVVLLAHLDLKVIRVPADPGLFADMVAAAVEWHQLHIVAGVEPGPDASDAYRDHLTARYPLDAGDERVATPELTLIAEALREAKADEREAKAAADLAANRIRAAMADASTLVGPGWRVTWKTQDGRTDWKAVAADYRRLLAANTPRIEVPDGFDLDAWLGFIAVTHTGEPSRVFRSYFTDTEDSTP